MKLNLNKRLGQYNNDLFKKLLIKKNTGSYGDIALPESTDAISIKNDTSFNVEHKDEASNAHTNTRDKFTPIRTKSEGKLKIASYVNKSGNALVEWAIGKVLDLVLGKSEYVASTRGASASITDGNADIAGLAITTEGVLLGMAGNYATLKLVNSGSSGSVTLTDNSPEFTLNYYNDTTISEVVTEIAANAKLACAADANGTAATDLLIDLLASASLSSGKTVYLSGGTEAGYIYDNSVAPQCDATVTLAKEKIGYVIPGVILDKMEIQSSGGNPTEISVDCETQSTLYQGMGKLVTAASNGNKLYLGADYNRFVHDARFTMYLDVVDNDGNTLKSVANEITGSGTDGTGTYIQVLNNVTADVGDYVKFHEPVTNPTFDPINGMSGSLKVDNKAIIEFRNVKFEYANNHQIIKDTALNHTISGFAASKRIMAKFSCEVYFRQSDSELIQKLSQSSVVPVPVEIKIGNKAGETITIFMRHVACKAPDLSDKGEEVSTFTLEGEAVTTPDAVNIPSVVITTT